MLSAALPGLVIVSVEYQTKAQTLQAFVGLANLGNTCFANSIMQCLMAIPELVYFFLTAAGPHKPSGLVSAAFGSLVQQLWASAASAADPYG